MPRLAVLRLGAWSGLLLGAALAGACFDAPRPAVQFSCDPAEAPQCPPGYTCEADRCCHLDGSDYAEHAGECQLGGGVLTSGAPPSTTDSGSGEGSTDAPSSSDSTASSGSGDTSGSGSTTGTSESGESDSTAGTSESSGTGT
jgi:hypothetical protein